MALIERESQLASLGALVDTVERGHGGACVLVCGEAGIGKTTLLNHFVREHGTRLQLLRGGCEALFTPRPLGPLADMAHELPATLVESIHTGRTYNGLFPAFLAYLRDHRTPTLLVIEDVHWADEATLDFVKYLGRRVQGVPVLFVLTYRDDELHADHPLRRVLGELPAASTHRLSLPALSESAVEDLARQAGRPSAGLFRATDGNPFFVTEVLANSERRIPASVRDAVLARLARLSPDARAMAETACVVPGRVERAFLTGALGAAPAALEQCLDSGIMRVDGRGIVFRHELARQSVERSLPRARFEMLHVQAFGALSKGGDSVDQLPQQVHHAQRAGLTDEVLRLAPIAAAKAARSSAHREAAAFYTLALEHAARLAPEARADLLEAAALEYKLTHDLDRALDALNVALALHRQFGDQRREGETLRLLATLGWERRGDSAVYVVHAGDAVDVLEHSPPSVALTQAYATLSHALALASRYAEAEVQAEKALHLAESLDDPSARVHALYRLGSARLGAREDHDAQAMLEQALALAIEHGLEEAAGNIFVSLQTFALTYHNHATSLEHGERGAAYCEARDLTQQVWGITERRGLSLFELGRWTEAEETLHQCLAESNLAPAARDTASFLLHRLAARRGEADAEGFWDIPRLLAAPVQMYFRPPYIAAACAEVAWLRGDLESTKQAASTGLASAFEGGEARLIGPLVAWLKRVGAELPSCEVTLLPQHQRELAGDWAGAAEVWAKRGCRFEEAMALTSGDEPALRRALDIFDGLGATPASQIVRQRLRAQGVRGVQRGPHSHARADSHGLTRREREVLDLIVQGLSNQAISDRLHRSLRTVEHHVSALLKKLGAATRDEAIVRAGKERRRFKK